MNENREKAKSYLRGIQQQKECIEYKSAEIIRLRATAQSVRSTFPSNCGFGHSDDRLGRIIAKIVDMEAEYKADVDSYLNAEREAVGFLDRITAQRANFLHMHYFQGLTWERIADMTNYSFRAAYYIGLRALDELYEVLRAEGKIEFL